MTGPAITLGAVMLVSVAALFYLWADILAMVMQ